ncbi:hypothetical protein C8R47DRAFT_1226698 [Mycena vitilis]|nr:hypothetical protein C8R47DRAFT_1226698 [Mycena vitilis]
MPAIAHLRNTATGHNRAAAFVCSRPSFAPSPDPMSLCLLFTFPEPVLPSGLLSPRSAMDFDPPASLWCICAPPTTSPDAVLSALPAIAFPAVTLPLELVDLVFDASVEHEGWDDIANFLVRRTTVKLVSRYHSLYVDRRPKYWDHILLTPSSLETFPDAVAAAGDLPIYLTISIPPRSTPPGVHWLDHGSPSPSYVSAAAVVVRGVVSRCAGITVDGHSRFMVESLLRLVISAPPCVLHYLAVSFQIPALGQFSSGLSTFGGFETDAPFGPIVPSYRQLTIRPTEKCSSHCSLVYTASTSCTMYQAHGDDLEWSEFVSAVASSETCSRLDLQRVTFVDSPIFVRSSPPIFSLTVLSLAFSGDFTMARMVACLNLPNLDALIAHLGSPADCACLSACGVFLSLVPTLKIVTPNSDHAATRASASSEFHTLFSLLHRVRRVDLRDASVEWVTVFFQASSIIVDAFGSFGSVNWHACPNLEHLDFNMVGLEQLKRLLTIRRLAGYDQLESLTLDSFPGNDRTEMDGWLRVHQISRLRYEAV